MRWLRERPVRWEELDGVDGKGRWKDGPVRGTRGDEDEVMNREERKGALFDDEDEGEDEEEEEEEEEAQPPAPTPTKTVTAGTPKPAQAVGVALRGARR